MISANPQVMHGQAVIAGTRVPVSVILDCLAAGMTAEEITAEHPTVTAEGVRAAAARIYPESVLRRDRRRRASPGGKHGGKPAARADVELGEDLPQVIGDGRAADEQLRGDLRV